GFPQNDALRPHDEGGASRGIGAIAPHRPEQAADRRRLRAPAAGGIAKDGPAVSHRDRLVRSQGRDAVEIARGERREGLPAPRAPSWPATRTLDGPVPKRAKKSAREGTTTGAQRTPS